MKKKSILLSLALASLLHAEQITSIEYENLTKISKSIANDTVGLKVGDEVNIDKVNQAIKDFFKYGYFDDIQSTMDNGILKFTFKEKPSIANVDILGFKSRDRDINITKKYIHLEKGMMYSEKRVNDAKEVLLRELEKEGFINSVIEVEIEKLNENAVSVIFHVNKGDEIVIKKVNYFGAKNLEQDDFEQATANKEEEFASWFITQNDGKLNAEQLKYDGKRIQEVYWEHGYLDAQVKDPFLEVDFASNQGDLDFYITEGIQYKVNNITIYVNSDIIDAKDLYPELNLKKEKVFNIKKLRKDVDFIKTTVSDLGYAYTQINYDLKKDEKNGTTDVIINVIPGDKVYINDVKITGNARTLDRVVRRNVYLAPGDLFSLTDYKDSISRLKRSGYFEDVSIEQKRVSSDKMDLVVKVKETPTGNILLGGGYGSYDGVMVTGSIQDKNIFGSGLTLGISADLSKHTTDLSIKLANPSINDSKYHGDIDIHSDKLELDNSVYNLDKSTKGFSIGVGREIFRDIKVGARYRLDFIREKYIYDTTATVSNPFTNEEYVTSSITPYINFDNTDDFYNPRSGFKVNSSLEYAGLGGDSEYIKSTSYFKYFYSLNELYDLDWILRYKLQAKFLVDNGQVNQGDTLSLGGVKSLRGFKSYAFPNYPTGEKGNPYKAMAATSIEMSFPLSSSAKMRWGAFYDYGMIGEDNISDIQRSSTGLLFEWISPFGPLQLIFAQPIDDEATDDTSTFEFSLGSIF